MVQVHSQESDLGSHIAISEAVIELYAIIDGQLFVKTDMLGMQVAVTIADTSAGRSLFKKTGFILQYAVGIVPYLTVLGSRNGGIEIFFGLGKIFIGIILTASGRPKAAISEVAAALA